MGKYQELQRLFEDTIKEQQRRRAIAHRLVIEIAEKLEELLDAPPGSVEYAALDDPGSDLHDELADAFGRDDDGFYGASLIVTLKSEAHPQVDFPIRVSVANPISAIAATKSGPVEFNYDLEHDKAIAYIADKLYGEGLMNIAARDYLEDR